MNFEEYNILGNIIDTTWGRGSTNTEQGASMGIKAQLLAEDQLLISFTSLISFGEPHERRRELSRMSSDSASIIEAYIKKTKSDFKEETGRTLKTKNISDNEDYELVSLGQYSGRRDAFYRRKIVLELK